VVGLFALADWGLSDRLFDQLIQIRAAQAGIIVLGFAGLRKGATWGISVATLIVAAVLLGTTAYIGALLGDFHTTGIIAAFVTTGAAGMMAWGRLPQTILVLIAAAAYGSNTIAVADFVELLGYQSIAITTILFLSVCFARGRERSSPKVTQQIRPEPQRADGDLFRQFADRAGDMAWIVDSNSGKLTYLSASHKRVLGKSLGHLPSEASLLKCFHPDDADEITATNKAFGLRATKTVDREIRAVRDDEERWLSVRLFPITDGDGQPYRIGAVATDITEERLVSHQRESDALISAALANASQKLVAALDQESLPESLCRVTAGIFASDMSHIFRVDGSQVTLAAGYGGHPGGPKEVEEIQISYENSKELLEKLAEDTVVVVAPEKLTQSSLTLLDGAHGFTSVAYFAIRRGDQITGFQSLAYCTREEPLNANEVKIAKAMSHLSSLAWEASQGTDELAHEDRLRTRFIANMSHELRTPLTVIIGYNDMLLDGSFGLLNPQQAETLERTQKNAKEILSLFSAALQLARYDQEGIVVHATHVDIGAMLHELAGEVRGLYQKPHVDVSWSIARTLPRIQTDSGKLRIALKNLIENAIKFTERGRVGITAVSVVNGIEFRIVDTGPGMNEETLACLFEPFRKASDGISSRKAGFGLGLFIAKRLLDALGAKVEVASYVGIGTTFTLRLPAEFRSAVRSDDPPISKPAPPPPPLSDPTPTVAPGEPQSKWWERSPIPREPKKKTIRRSTAVRPATDA
jgi:PAS domain S-box-containing protein